MNQIDGKVDRLILLIAPNVSEQMGGEAIKALQIFLAYKTLNPRTIQITHERCKAELSGRLKLDNVRYVADGWIAKLLWRSVILRKLLDVWFTIAAVKLAESLIKPLGSTPRATVIHQTEPNSPVAIRKLSKSCYNAIGPINGNIYYPKIFRDSESAATFLRRKLHMSIQRLSAIVFRGAKRANLILAAGGERTTSSLLAAGYHRDTIKETIDCGVRDSVLDQIRIMHRQENFRFVHYGRLVFHKGTSLAIESLARSDKRVCLDIIGSGPELENCQLLVKRLGLEQRVRFLNWFERHEELLGALRQYRGLILPSLADANGIVVQEALALGLPPICLNWGGPQLLIEPGISGFLIDPTSKDDVISGIASALEMLGRDAELAERMSIAGRARAEQWRWSRLAGEWMTNYPQVSQSAP